MQHVNGIPVYDSDPNRLYEGLRNYKPTWYSAQGGVYRCRQKMSPKAFIAIKKYHVEESQDHPHAFIMPRDLVENEIYAMTRCAPHPNILKLLSVHLHQECIYLIMPLCTGGSMQEYVFENRITVGQLVYILRSLVSGLHEIHRHGYIHRDIKCDNIFLTQETNECVIGDFGVVSIQPTADSAAEEAGVVLFWAPESVEGRIIDSKVDIWALGIVIMEILNGGKAPYEDEECSEDKIKEIILEVGRPHYPPSLPPMLVNFMDRCLEVDPRHRASAEELLKHPFLTDSEAEYLFPSYPLHEFRKEYSEQGQDHIDTSVERDIESVEEPALEKQPIVEKSIAEELYLPEFDEAEMLRIQNRLETFQLLTQTDNMSSTSLVTSQTISTDMPLNSWSIAENAPSLEEHQAAKHNALHVQDNETPSTQPLPVQKPIRRQRSYLPRSSMLLCNTQVVHTDTSHRIHELKKLHPVQQAYDVFQRRAHLYKNYRLQGSRLPLFTAAVGPKEQLPSAKSAQTKELKRVKSMMSPKKEERSPVKVRRAFSVANFKEKDIPSIERTVAQPTSTRTQQKRISQPVVRASSTIDTGRSNRRKADIPSQQQQPLEKPTRKPPPSNINARSGKPVSTSERKEDTNSHRVQTNRNETMAKLLKQEASLHFNDRRARIKA